MFPKVFYIIQVNGTTLEQQVLDNGVAEGPHCHFLVLIPRNPGVAQANLKNGEKHLGSPGRYTKGIAPLKIEPESRRLILQGSMKVFLTQKKSHGYKKKF
jgi:hypothetical protein